MRSSFLQVTLLVFASFFTFQLAAQATHKWEFGPRAGILSYQGDLLKPMFSLRASGPMSTLYLRRFVSSHFSLEAAIGFGAFLGDDQIGKENNRRRVIESLTYMGNGSLSLQYDLRKMQIAESKNWGWTPFLTAGMGGVYTQFDNIKVPVTSTDYGLENNFSWYAPMGGGARLFNTDRTVLSFESRFNLTGTDLLEGISQSANPNDNDTFWTFTFSIGRLF
jgi:OmpA-OmpF porin, OOP family